MASYAEVIDLTSSPEPDISARDATAILAGRAHTNGKSSLPELLKELHFGTNLVKSPCPFPGVPSPAPTVQTNGLSSGGTSPPAQESQGKALELAQVKGGFNYDSHVRKRRSSVSLDAAGTHSGLHKRLKHTQDVSLPPAPSATLSPGPASDATTTTFTAKDTRKRASVARGTPYSEEDNALLLRLKRDENRSWTEIEQHFPRRSRASLQVHFTTKVWKRSSEHNGQKTAGSKQETVDPTKKTKDPAQEGRPRREVKRDGGRSAMDGFVSWKDIKSKAPELAAAEMTTTRQSEPPLQANLTFPYDRIAPRSLSRCLRQRELGENRRGITRISEELVNHTSAGFRLRKTFSPTCGDVNSVAWSPDNRNKGVPMRFAAASIAISDDRNMQYNGALNLLVGNLEEATLQELPDHHVERPIIPPDLSNPNSLQDMRNTQDSRLYSTVNAVAFSSCGTRLFSAGDDGALRSYRFESRHAVLEHTIRHEAPVALMSVNSDDLVATASKTSRGACIQVQQLQRESYQVNFERNISQTELAPAALRWGTSPWHKQYLLAGFSGECHENDALTIGATYLWDAYGSFGEKIGHTPNVFQVAWNPSPSSASTWFCVASGPARTDKTDTRSVVQCFGPGKTAAMQSFIRWDCPARDINELTYCQHDPMLIAAGGTNGRVYIWDKRFASRNQQALHVFKHGNTVQVIDHDRDFEEADTGIGFLGWGATSSRLYTGSSDGVVKVWNPYRAPENAFVGDVAKFSTAVMSGGFSPDYRDLLIGEDSGRLNLLSLDPRPIARDESSTFKLNRSLSSSIPSTVSSCEDAKALLATGQIELRPMGNLPVRQAVQGRNYSGPFFRPTAEAWDNARSAFRNAEDQIRAPETSEGKVDVAKKQLQAAENLLMDLHARESSWQQLEADAIAKQRSWALQENCPDTSLYGRTGGARHVPGDVDATQTDSRQRIPEILKHLTTGPLDVRGLNCQELYDLSLGPRCAHCDRAAQTTNKRLRAHFKSLCKTQRVQTVGRLSTSCRTCGAPIQNKTSPEARDVCVRCSFACIRCGQEAQLSASTSYLICTACNLSWTVDVLGYNMDQGTGLKKPSGQGNNDDEAGEEVIDTHLDHLWTLWGTENYSPNYNADTL